MRQLTDVTLRRALARIEESYVEPERLDPGRMLDAALRAARADLEAAVAESRRCENRLVERLAPPLENVLSRASAERVNPLRAAMLTGALRCLDRHSRALSGEARRRLHQRLSGTTCGIGLRIGRRDGRIRVLRCLPGGAAEAAGVRPGDTLLSVAGEPTEKMLVSDALKRLRGRPRTTVTLRLDRRPPLELSIRRQRLVLSGVSGRVDASAVGVLRLSCLNKATLPAIERWFASRAGGAVEAGLILDLRGNRGGSMLAAAALADRFVPRGTLLEALDGADRPVPGLAHRVDATDATKPGWPIAVLQDETTCSAAELLAAALAWNDRAILVGGRTRGKHTILKLYPYAASDLTLRLTVATMRTAGRRLPQQGLVPDFESRASGGAGTPDSGSEGEDVVLATARRRILDHGRASRADWLARISRG